MRLVRGSRIERGRFLAATAAAFGLTLRRGAVALGVSSTVGAEVAERLGLSPATVTTITRRLVADGLVAEGDPRTPPTGRPSIPLALIPDSAHALGVQVALEHVTVALTRLDASVVRAFRQPFDPTAADAVGRLTGLIRAELDDAATQGLGQERKPHPPSAGPGVPRARVRVG